MSDKIDAYAKSVDVYPLVKHYIRHSAQALSGIRIKLFIILSQYSKQFQLILIPV